MKSILKNFRIGKIGPLEFLFAMYPILVAYNYGPLRFDMLILLIMLFLALQKKKGYLHFKPLLFLSIFILAHELIWFVVTGGSITQLNNFISIVLFISALFVITPALDSQKMINSISIVSLFVVLGLIYHLLILQTGSTVSPLRILPDPGADSRFHEISTRPTSFFEEPSGFITYMLMPLLFSLIEKKYVLTGIVAIFILLSTSTNGIVFLFLMLIIYILTQRISKMAIVTIVIGGIALGYLFMNNEAFEKGRDKLETTEYDQTSRLYNGPEVVFNMPTEHLYLGIPYHTIDEYYLKTRYLKDVVLLESHSGAFFVSSFWLIIIKYGIVGLFLVLYLYVSILKRTKLIWPYMIIFIVAMFSQSTFLNSGWTFQLIFMMAYIRFLDNNSDLMFNRKNN